MFAKLNITSLSQPGLKRQEKNYAELGVKNGDKMGGCRNPSPEPRPRGSPGKAAEAVLKDWWRGIFLNPLGRITTEAGYPSLKLEEKQIYLPQ